MGEPAGGEEGDICGVVKGSFVKSPSCCDPGGDPGGPLRGRRDTHTSESELRSGYFHPLQITNQKLNKDIFSHASGF